MGKKKYFEIVSVIVLIVWALLFLRGLDYENIYNDPLFYPYVLSPIIALVCSIIAIIKNRSWLSYATAVISILTTIFIVTIVL